MNRINKSFAALGLLVALSLAPLQAHAVVWTMPTIPPVGATDQSLTTQGIISNGGQTTVGSHVQSAIGTPSAPTMTTNGTAGVTSIVYACTGVDINEQATIPSATATITTANATLTTTNSVNITCPGKVGALAFLIHKVDTSHVLGICYTTSGAPCTYVDDGSVATTFTYTPNTVDQTGYTTVPALTATNLKAVTTVTGCLTSGVIDNTCAEPTATFAAAFADANYRVSCSCVTPVGVPVISSVGKTASGVQVTIASLTAATAQCGTVECNAYHP